MSRIDPKREFIPVRVAVLTVSDTRTPDDDRSGDTLAARIEEAGHRIAARTIVRDERAAIAQAMGQVAEPFRTALGLVDVGGLSYEEAAQTLACAVGTVKSRVNRGRLLFRDHYVKLSGGAEHAPAARSPRRLP